MARPARKQFPRTGPNRLHQRIRPSGTTLIKMEIRVPVLISDTALLRPFQIQVSETLVEQLGHLARIMPEGWRI
jgi:hypothetical protein